MFIRPRNNNSQLTYKNNQPATVHFGFLLVVVAAVILVSSSGCAPQLSVSNTIDIERGEVRTILVDSISQEQTIKVEASSPVAFDIHIHLAGDEDEVDRAILALKESPKILAAQTGATSATLEAQVPADKEAAVRFQCSGAESCSVKYSISN